MITPFADIWKPGYEVPAPGHLLKNMMVPGTHQVVWYELIEEWHKPPMLGPDRSDLRKARLCHPKRRGNPGILGCTAMATIRSMGDDY